MTSLLLLLSAFSCLFSYFPIFAPPVPFRSYRVTSIPTLLFTTALSGTSLVASSVYMAKKQGGERRVGREIVRERELKEREKLRGILGWEMATAEEEEEGDAVMVEEVEEDNEKVEGK